nr:MAG TPA: hypothetical protein [Caudoviricetes sp.]
MQTGRSNSRASGGESSGCSGALSRFYVVRETECIPEALLILIFCRPHGRLLFYREVSGWNGKRKQWIFLLST